MQVACDLPTAFVSLDIKPAGGVVTGGELGLEFDAALVIPLIERLQRSALNQKRCDTELVGSYRREIVQSNVDRRSMHRVHVGGYHGALIDHLHGVMRGMRYDSHLANGSLSGLDTDIQP
jgi:hypothetical protein